MKKTTKVSGPVVKAEQVNESVERIEMTEEEKLRAMLAEARVREAETLLALRKEQFAAVSRSIAEKYSDGGKHEVIDINLERGVTRAPVEYVRAMRAAQDESVQHS
jgi:hypothetical protein